MCTRSRGHWTRKHLWTAPLPSPASAMHVVTSVFAFVRAPIVIEFCIGDVRANISSRSPALVCRARSWCHWGGQHDEEIQRECTPYHTIYHVHTHAHTPPIERRSHSPPTPFVYVRVKASGPSRDPPFLIASRAARRPARRRLLRRDRVCRLNEEEWKVMMMATDLICAARVSRERHVARLSECRYTRADHIFIALENRSPLLSLSLSPSHGPFVRPFRITLS